MYQGHAESRGLLLARIHKGLDIDSLVISVYSSFLMYIDCMLRLAEAFIKLDFFLEAA